MSSKELLDNWIDAHQEPEDGWPMCEGCCGDNCFDCEDGFVTPQKLAEQTEELRALWRNGNT